MEEEKSLLQIPQLAPTRRNNQIYLRNDATLQHVELTVSENGVVDISASFLRTAFDWKLYDSIKYSGKILKITRKSNRNDLFSPPELQVHALSMLVPIEEKHATNQAYRPLTMRQGITCNEHVTLRLFGRYELTINTSLPTPKKSMKKESNPCRPRFDYSNSDMESLEHLSELVDLILKERANNPELFISEEAIGEEETAIEKENTILYEKPSQVENSSLCVADAMSCEPRHKDQNTQLKRLKRGGKVTIPKATAEFSVKECAICLNEITGKITAKLGCNHYYCYRCIRDWSKVTNICPLCKRGFSEIAKLNTLTGEPVKSVKVRAKKQRVEADPDTYMEYVVDHNCDDFCYECRGGEDEMKMLVCDRCNWYCCHIYCLNPPLTEIPDTTWYCKFCLENPDAVQRPQRMQPALILSQRPSNLL